MNSDDQFPRRRFLKGALGAVGVAAQGVQLPALGQEKGGGEHGADQHEGQRSEHARKSAGRGEIAYPRRFEHRQLKMISFPLGGVAAGSIGLGGRGQLCNWEIFNRPNKGYAPAYCFPAMWAQVGSGKPVAHVLESQLLPPFEGQNGLGSRNAPGLSRLQGATFTGEYPLAHIDFEEETLQVRVELEAFSPFIPHDADDSGLPVAILRYSVTNPGAAAAKVAIVYSIENPVVGRERKQGAAQKAEKDGRRNEYRSGGGVIGLTMVNSMLAQDDPMFGEFVLAATPGAETEASYWLGWPAGRWWNSPLLFWDQFSGSGSLGAQPEEQALTGALCLKQTIAPGASVTFQFLLAWRFPNRTPDWCGWSAPAGEGKTVIGNFYSSRFSSAWDAVMYAAKNLRSLEESTRKFAKAFGESSLPGEIKEAASANLSTLATTTCFRTADGEFHGFEGSDDQNGCCFGNCTHVWNYETTTGYLFPSFARSLRRSAFGYSMDDAGAIHFRQLLPDGKARSGFAAADGQMGQIMHAYHDWRISGDDELLRTVWPRTKKAIEFAWVAGGWDANRDGVMEGVQHNTYDVEFYGPNPMCGIYYLGALRAAEEMARAAGDSASAGTYRALFEQGSRWIDAHLFNGEYYVQQIRGYRSDEIAKNLRSDMGSENTVSPQYQVGAGCLVDQLVGQYLADICGLGPLVSSENIEKTLRSIYRYNYKRSLAQHDTVQRTFALNGEASLVICDYGKGTRPQIPFPYFAETMTGFEYSAAVLMMNWGMVEEGLECVRNIRHRYDGEKRNPWDEAECGHHYARAMSAWSAVLALSGFKYDGTAHSVVAVPLVSKNDFRCFWSTGTGWGTFSHKFRPDGHTRFTLRVLAGKLRCRSVEINGTGTRFMAKRNGSAQSNTVVQRGGRSIFELKEMPALAENDELTLEVLA
jgi:non-lysosomal glucosylceramidase